MLAAICNMDIALDTAESSATGFTSEGYSSAIIFGIKVFPPVIS
jgi:hypothetical protein